MIFRLSNDQLREQRTSPTPHTTPEPGNYKELSDSKSHSSSDGEQKKRPQQKSSPSRSGGRPEGGHGLRVQRKRPSTHEKKQVEISKSTGHLLEQDGKEPQQSQKDSLRPRAQTHHQSRLAFSRTRSGVAISNTAKPVTNPPRSFSPPADLSQRDNTAPPPPSSKPPPLPTSVSHMHRYYANARDTRSSSVGTNEAPRFFPGAYPSQERVHQPLGPSISIPLYANTTGTLEKQRSSSMSYAGQNQRRGHSPHGSNSPPVAGEYQHALDNIVRDAYSNAPSTGVSTGNAHHRQASWPNRVVESGPGSHPLQTAVRGHTQSGTAISSYPWHQAHPRRSVIVEIIKHNSKLFCTSFAFTQLE